VFAAGLLCSIGLSVSFARSANQILAGVAFYVALVYFTFMMSFVREYVTLISKHLTYKEAQARRKTAKDYCLVDSFKDAPISFLASVKAHYDFFMVKKIPLSNFPTFNDYLNPK